MISFIRLDFVFVLAVIALFLCGVDPLKTKRRCVVGNYLYVCLRKMSVCLLVCLSFSLRFCSEMAGMIQKFTQTEPICFGFFYKNREVLFGDLSVWVFTFIHVYMSVFVSVCVAF